MTDHPSIHSVTQEKQWGGWGGGQWLVWWESSHGITQLTFQKIKLRISVFLAPTNLVQVWPMHSQMWPKSTFSKISKFLFVKCWKTNLFVELWPKKCHLNGHTIGFCVQTQKLESPQWQDSLVDSERKLQAVAQIFFIMYVFVNSEGKSSNFSLIFLFSFAQLLN